MKKSKSKEHVKEYKKSQQQAKKVVRNARKRYEKILQRILRIIQKHSTPKIPKTKTSIGPPKAGDTDIQSDAEMCKVLNVFLLSFHNG